MNKEEKETEKEETDLQLIEEAFIYKFQHQYPEGAGENRKRVIKKKAAKFVAEMEN